MREWWSRLRSLWRRDEIAADLRDEIDAHLQIAIEEAAARGHSADAVRRQFGSRARVLERAGEAWRFPTLDTIAQDLRYGLRMLRRAPGYTAAAVLSLAVGIGANTALFSVLDALVLQPLPVHEPARLALFSRLETNGRLRQFSYAWYDRLRDQPAVFSSVSASWTVERYQVRIDGAADPGNGPVSITLASGNYFSTLGVGARLGRTIADRDDDPGAPVAAVISDRFWYRAFAAAADVLGRTIRVHATSLTVVGVLPPGFHGETVGRPVDVWVPFATASLIVPEMPGGPGQFPAMLIGRLRDGVTLAGAEASAQGAFREIVMAGAGTNPTPEHRRYLEARTLSLESAATGYSERRPAIARLLTVAIGAAAVVLLIVCANVATLSLARAASRHHEVALRLAIGAGRMRVLRQFVTEAALLSAIALPLGAGLALWGGEALVAMLSVRAATVAPMALDVSRSVRVFAFSAAVTIAATLLFAVAPAIRSANVAPGPALGGRGSDRSRGAGPGRWLIASQAALTIVLLSIAGLLQQTVVRLRAQDLGVSNGQLLLLWTAPVQGGRNGPALAALLDTMRERLAAVPGVRRVAISNGGLIEGGEDAGGPSEETSFDGYPPKAGLTLRFFAVTPGYFETVGLPRLAGRSFEDSDNDMAQPVAMIGERLARFIYGDADPIGRRFGGPDGRRLTIVGVVRDAKAGSLRDSRGLWYVPYRQNAAMLRRPWCVSIDAAGRGAVIERVLSELHGIDPDLPLLRTTTLDGQLNDALAQERLLAWLSGLAALAAAVVACIGVYGVTAYATARRRTEIAVRLAVGATPADVVRMTIADAIRLVSIGTVAGVPGAIAAGRAIASQLFGIGPADPLVLLGAAALMLVCGLLACSIPAFLSSRVDPAAVLR